MSQVKRSNPSLYKLLENCFLSGKPQDLYECLSSLSNRDFRTASYLLSEKILLEHNNFYWEFFNGIVPKNTKAFLGTFLKAGTLLYRKKIIDINNKIDKNFAQKATIIDKKKIFLAFFPFLQTPQEVVNLLKLFCVNKDEKIARLLIQFDNPATYFVFFQICKINELNHEVLKNFCRDLIINGTKKSYNMASMVKSYFDLKDLPATFSLKMKDYQLSRLDESFSKFKKFLVK